MNEWGSNYYERIGTIVDWALTNLDLGRLLIGVQINLDAPLDAVRQRNLIRGHI